MPRSRTASREPRRIIAASLTNCLSILLYLSEYIKKSSSSLLLALKLWKRAAMISPSEVKTQY